MNFFTMFKIIVFGLEYFPSALYAMEMSSNDQTKSVCYPPTPTSITCQHASSCRPYWSHSPLQRAPLAGVQPFPTGSGTDHLSKYSFRLKCLNFPAVLQFVLRQTLFLLMTVFKDLGNSSSRVVKTAEQNNI